MSEVVDSSAGHCANSKCGQAFAWVWFFSVIVIGSVGTYFLANIDAYLYSVKGRVLDYDAYRENRMASSSLGRDILDPRQAPLSAVSGR
ncbi:MAG: hypothetical protein PHC51_01360 [bacterium]|nr:hypothetical protein [bacterium]